jgi:putative transposase
VDRFSFYLVLDIFSRYIVGWEVAPTESSAISKSLFLDAVREQDVQPGQLHIHADDGAMMKAKSLALIFADLGISKSHSKPRISTTIPTPKRSSRR